MTAFPKVALIGPGAIGTTIAAALFERGRAPMVCGRTAHSALVLRTDEGEIVVPGPVHTDPMAISAPFDLVFVAVKTTQTEAIAPWLTALCSPDTVVCVLQNGVEQRQQFAPLTGGATVLPSVVWFPAQRDADASVWLRATPRLTLPDLPGAERVQQALAGTRCAVDLAADFTTVAWRKLLQNAVAGLMVLTGRRAGMFAREDITAVAGVSTAFRRRSAISSCRCWRRPATARADPGWRGVSPPGRDRGRSSTASSRQSAAWRNRQSSPSPGRFFPPPRLTAPSAAGRLTRR